MLWPARRAKQPDHGLIWPSARISRRRLWPHLGLRDDNLVVIPHDVKNIYKWSSSGTAPDGGAFTKFLNTLNGDATGVGNCVSSDGSSQTGGFVNRCDWRLPTIAELQTILGNRQSQRLTNPPVCEL